MGEGYWEAKWTLPPLLVGHLLFNLDSSFWTQLSCPTGANMLRYRQKEWEDEKCNDSRAVVLNHLYWGLSKFPRGPQDYFNYSKQTLTLPPPQKKKKFKICFIWIHPFNICPRHKRESDFKRVTSTLLLNRKTSTLSEKMYKSYHCINHTFKSYSFVPYLSIKDTHRYVKCTY